MKNMIKVAVLSGLVLGGCLSSGFAQTSRTSAWNTSQERSASTQYTHPFLDYADYMSHKDRLAYESLTSSEYNVLHAYRAHQAQLTADINPNSSSSRYDHEVQQARAYSAAFARSHPRLAELSNAMDRAKATYQQINWQRQNEPYMNPPTLVQPAQTVGGLSVRESAIQVASDPVRAFGSF